VHGTVIDTPRFSHPLRSGVNILYFLDARCRSSGQAATLSYGLHCCAHAAPVVWNGHAPRYGLDLARDVHAPPDKHRALAFSAAAQMHLRLRSIGYARTGVRAICITYFYCGAVQRLMLSVKLSRRNVLEAYQNTRRLYRVALNSAVAGRAGLKPRQVRCWVALTLSDGVAWVCGGDAVRSNGMAKSSQCRNTSASPNKDCGTFKKKRVAYAGKAYQHR